MAWIFAIPRTIAIFGGYQTTKVRMHHIYRTMKSFKNEFSRYPLHLNELRTFSRFNKQIFHAYDGYGQSIDYQLLDKGNYVIRSFGSDGHQNTIKSKSDIFLTSISTETLKGVTSDQNIVKPFLIYNPGYASGAFNSNKTYFASLYVNEFSNKRKLIVKRVTANKKLMLPTHDRIEEFIWIPNQDLIVYTATGSDIYKDGVYLWNLQTDETFNLLDGNFDKFDMHGLSDTKKIFASIAGFDNAKNTLYLYATIKQSNSLDPSFFYSKKCLLAINIAKRVKNTYELSLPMVNIPPNIFLTSQGNKTFKANKLQKDQSNWINLPLRGSQTSVLTAWTRAADQYSSNYLFRPYSYLYLSLLYSQSAFSYPNGDSSRRFLKSYGIEISSKLVNDYTAPSYIKAMGQYIWNDLSKGKPIAYKIAKFK